MARGPRPKSKELRAAQGVRHHRRKTKSDPPATATPAEVAIEEATSPASPVDPPKWLAAKSRTVWRIAAPAIFRQGLLRDADALAFGRYCDWFVQYLDLQRSARKRKIVTETKSRHVKMQRMDKGFQALAIIDKRLTDYEDRFGMNPRERLAIMAKLADLTQHPPTAPPPKPSEPSAGRLETPDALPASAVGFLTAGRPH